MGWTSNGEWLKYTINVATAGAYNVSLRVASPAAVACKNDAGGSVTMAVPTRSVGGRAIAISSPCRDKWNFTKR